MALNYEAFFVIKRFFCEVTRAYCSLKIRPVPVGHPVVGNISELPITKHHDTHSLTKSSDAYTLP
jgi:hypothetical protein